MTNLAPIIVFCYDRPKHLEQTLDALSRNELANQSTLYIYCDGPKKGASDEMLQKIADVRQVARKRQWCKEVHVVEREHNVGLMNNIVGAVTEIVNAYGRVITMEDDIITSKGYLRFMNESLELYKDDKQVMHISGYMWPHINIVCQILSSMRSLILEVVGQHGHVHGSIIQMMRTLCMTIGVRVGMSLISLAIIFFSGITC